MWIEDQDALRNMAVIFLLSRTIYMIAYLIVLHPLSVSNRMTIYAQFLRLKRSKMWFSLFHQIVRQGTRHRTFLYILLVHYSIGDDLCLAVQDFFRGKPLPRAYTAYIIASLSRISGMGQHNSIVNLVIHRYSRIGPSSPA